jgi:large-conductance mechanosensitive channel
MILAIIVFLILGFYLEYILHSVLDEQKRKKQKQEEDEQAEVLKEKEAAISADMGNKIDYRVDSDEFTPLNVSKAIKSVIK